MATFKDVEDNLKSFIIQEQSDAHNIKSVNVSKYNNIKISETTKSEISSIIDVTLITPVINIFPFLSFKYIYVSPQDTPSTVTVLITW